MRIADNVEMFEINGERGVLYPVLTWDDNEVVLIDTGLPGQTELIKEAVTRAGFVPEKITKVILTHQDLDHVGGAKVMAGLGAKVLAHEEEAPYIQGEKTSIRILDLESRLDQLNEGERTFYERAKKGAPYFYVHVDKQLKDNDFLDYCGGIKVIHTPGHTPGHIALLLKRNNIIVAGDAANISGSLLTGADPNYTRDLAQAQASYEKMLRCNASAFVCYHGGLYRGS